MGSVSVHVRVGAAPGPVGPTCAPPDELLVLLSPLVPLLLLDVDVFPDAPELPGPSTPLVPDELDDPPTELEFPAPAGAGSSSPQATNGRATKARTKTRRPKRMGT